MKKMVAFAVIAVLVAGMMIPQVNREAEILYILSHIKIKRR